MTTGTYDVAVAADCRLISVAAPLADEIRAQHRAGYRTAIVHVASGRHDSAPFAEPIRACLDHGEADLLLPGDAARARVLVARSPATFRELPDDLPTVRAERAVLVADVLPIGESGPRYDIDRVHGNLIRFAGTDVAWAPIAPHIRDELAVLGAAPLMPADWEAVIDPSRQPGDRDGVIGGRPVIGTTGDQSSVGSDGFVLRTHPIGRPPGHGFVAGVDVYAAEPALDSDTSVRAVLEALAAGAIVVAPRHLEPVFGDVCLYGDLIDVRDQIEELHGDPEAFLARSRAGVELVQKRFATDAHTDRIAALVGDPSEQHQVPTAEPDPARGTVVVDLTRGEHVDTLVSSIIRATVAEPGPRLVVLPAARAGELGARAAVETFPRVIDGMPAADRRRYLRERLTGIAAAHRPRRIIVIDDGSVPARELLSGVDRAATDIWHVQPVGTSEPDGEHLADRLGAVLPPGWGIARMKGPEQIAPRQPASRPSEDVLAKISRHARRWVAAAGRAIRHGLIRALGGSVPEARDDSDHTHGVRLPVADAVPGGDELPIALIIITDAYAEPAPGVRAIAERRLVTGAFRPALLAPPDWEAEAAAAGITVETLLPEATWSTQYGPGWSGYVRRRIRETCAVLRPATVVLGTPTTDGELLDVIESSHGD